MPAREALEIASGGVGAGVGGAREVRACPACPSRLYPQHPVSGWSRPEAGAAWPLPGGAGTWALWALNPTTHRGLIDECLSCCPNPAFFPMFSPVHQPSACW